MKISEEQKILFWFILLLVTLIVCGWIATNWFKKWEKPHQDILGYLSDVKQTISNIQDNCYLSVKK